MEINGADSNFNASADAEKRIATLGIDIESRWQGEKVWISGTSFATPIAAAMAANILEFMCPKVNTDQDTILWSHVSSFLGMRAVLKLMCVKTDKNLYLAPWRLGNCTDETGENIKERLVYGD